MAPVMHLWPILPNHSQFQQDQMEHDIATDSGVESAETLPSGEIIMAKTEMETDS